MHSMQLGLFEFYKKLLNSAKTLLHELAQKATGNQDAGWRNYSPN